MAYRLTWSPSACLDLKELASYISESSPEASVKFIKKVFDTVEYIPDFPKSRPVVPEFENSNIREEIRKPCRIIFRIKPKKRTIEIVRIWHSAKGTPQI
ncbi:MAG: type II toxin-antitoxin system RelE/ParE family toxin [Sedimentisphaerales bacterium]|nr:type II toxin-antitoxin system RelE/ParE family toxin [Sedimentisphaerales bacterium]